MLRPAVLVSVFVLMGATACQPEADQLPRNPTLVDFLPSDGWVFDQTPTAIELLLRGEKDRTRPVAEVVKSISLRSVSSTQRWELPQGNEVDNGAYNGTHFQTYVLPDGLAEGEYELIARFRSWGEKLVSAQTPGAEPVDPTGVDWTSRFVIR